MPVTQFSFSASPGGILFPLDMFRPKMLATLIAEALIGKARNVLDARIELVRHPFSQLVLLRIHGSVVGSDPGTFWRENLDLTLYIVFFFPGMLALIYSGWNFAAMSVRFRELSIFSPAGMPVFPLKAMLPVVGVFLCLQGIAEVLRCILCIREGQWPARQHDVEELEKTILEQAKKQQAEDQHAQRMKGAAR